MNATPTGYDPNIRFYATRYHQGGRIVFSLDLSLTQVADLLPAPDPHNPTEGNRQVKENHARAFGDYIRHTADWVAPALVLRAPNIFEFEVQTEIAGTQFGIISFPVMARTDLRILDGQHRTLGIHLAIRGISADLEKSRNSLANAKRIDAEDLVIQQLQAEIDKLNAQRARLAHDRTSVQIFIEDSQIAYKQMFFDIADNALGITSSVKARFDNRKVVNRALEGVMKHSLFKGRVDYEQDRMAGNNPNILGAKQVAEIIRTIAVGIDGRVGRRLEDELDEGELVERTNNFLDILLASFPPLAAVADGDLTPQALRSTNLLGSTVILRVLAGVYTELADTQMLDDDDVTEYFQKLAPSMVGPVEPGSIWIEHVPNNIFSVGSLSPRSRRQDVRTLHDSLVSWGKDNPVWLDSLMPSIAGASGAPTTPQRPASVSDGGANPGSNHANFNRDGTLPVTAAARATHSASPKASPVPVTRGTPTRRSFRRDWSKLPVGTALMGPPEVGPLVMGVGGRLTDGCTPNAAFEDAGLVRNAWQHLRVADGRSAGEAYDAGEWD